MSIVTDNLREILAAQQQQIAVLRARAERAERERDLARLELQEQLARAAIREHGGCE